MKQIHLEFENERKRKVALMSEDKEFLNAKNAILEKMFAHK